VSATEFADKLLLGLGREASPSGFLLWGQLGHIQEGTQTTRRGARAFSSAELGWIFLCGSQSQVGKIKAWLGLKHWTAASSCDLWLRLNDMREPGKGRQLEACIYQTGHSPWHFGERRAWQVHSGVTQCPLVQVYSMQRTKAIQVG
jgi:hypothetical protein